MGKYKKQLFTTFILTITLLVSILIFFISTSFSRNQKNNYLNTLQQATNTKTNGADTSMTVIVKVLDSLFKSSAIENWSKSNTSADYYYNSLESFNQLKKITSDLSLIDYKIAITKQDDTSHVISIDGTVDKEIFFTDETSLNHEQIAYIFDHFKENDSPLTLTAYEENQLKEIYYIVKKKYVQSNLLYFVKIPSYTLFGKDNEQDFILFNNEHILAYNNMDEANKNMADEIHSTSLEFKKDKNYFQYKDKIVFISNFTGMDWTIAYIYNNIGMSMTQVITYIIFPFFLLILLALLISRSITNLLYQPIKEAISDIALDSDNPVIDEFQLLKQNANKITILTHELKEALNDKETLVSQRFYRGLLFGYDVDPEIYNNYTLKSSSYCVALIEFRVSVNESHNDEVFFLKNSIYSSIQKHENLQYVDVNHKTCALIIQTDKLSNARKTVLDITDYIGETIDLKISISEIKNGIENINECYKEALKILEYKYLYDKSRILTMQQLSDLDTTIYHYPLFTENKLIQNIIEGKETAITIFDELIRENIQHRNLTPEALKNFIFALVGTLIRVFQELKSTPDKLLNQHIDFENLYNSWNNVNIIYQIKNIITITVEAINMKNDSMDDKLLSDMLNYIYENYSDDIMLNDMANKFNISPKYCSALFKKLSDDNFKNYLNKYRIERAKEFLEKDPDLKITDLSSMVGFNSSNSFIRVFSKYTGLTPKAFADKIR